MAPERPASFGEAAVRVEQQGPVGLGLDQAALLQRFVKRDLLVIQPASVLSADSRSITPFDNWS